MLRAIEEFVTGSTTASVPDRLLTTVVFVNVFGAGAGAGAAGFRDAVSRRVGIHTAEVEECGDDIAGVGVHVGARVAAAATRVKSG